MGRCDPGPLQRLRNAFAELSQSYAGEEYWHDLDARTEWKERKLTETGAGEPTAVHHSDVVQGGHADCFLMAGLAALAQQHPDPDGWLRDLVRDNGDGSYTVTFYERQALPPDYNPLTGPPSPAYVQRLVTVSDELMAAARSDDGQEKWPAVVEAAYAQAYGGEGAKPFDKRDQLGDAMERLTGIPTTHLDPRSVGIDQLEGYLKDHQAVVVKTFNAPPLQGYGAYDMGALTPHREWRPWEQAPKNDRLATWHEYYVHSVDKESGTVVLNNVWNDGRDEIRVPFDQFQQAIERVDVNPVYKR